MLPDNWTIDVSGLMGAMVDHGGLAFDETHDSSGIGHTNGSLRSKA
jgi:hypothetical protein